jgi:cytochrome b involved in lipid metabolism
MAQVLVPAQISQSSQASLTESQQGGTEASIAYKAANDTSYTLAHVATHNTQANCWTVVFEKVYNITTYIKNHPGGASSISKICGKDGTSLFDNKHGGASSQALILSTYKIGSLYKPPAISCDPGYFVSPSQGICTAAPKGFFVSAVSSASGVKAATACSLGKFSSALASTECIPTPPGYFADAIGSVQAKPCQKGYFSSVSGASICQIAPKGSYVDEVSSIIAKSCQSGLTTAMQGSTTSSSCYKPIIQVITGLTAPKSLKYGSITYLALTTNAKAIASYKEAGSCTASQVNLVTKVGGKPVTKKILKVSATSKTGTCKITLSSLAKDKYLGMSTNVVIKVSKSGK